MSKKLKECPYLWEISTEAYTGYVFAESASKALQIAELEINEIDEIKLKIICFANEILNYN